MKTWYYPFLKDTSFLPDHTFIFKNKAPLLKEYIK